MNASKAKGTAAETAVVRIEVRGIPAPQGSKRHVGRGIMLEMSKAVGPWREAVRAEAQRVVLAGQWWLPGQPVAVEIEFRLPRPRTAPKRITLPAKRPDVDKLARAVLDGLVSASVFPDDAQVTWLCASKAFADDITPAGAIILISDDKGLHR